MESYSRIAWIVLWILGLSACHFKLSRHWLEFIQLFHGGKTISFVTIIENWKPGLISRVGWIFRFRCVTCIPNCPSCRPIAAAMI